MFDSNNTLQQTGQFELGPSTQSGVELKKVVILFSFWLLLALIISGIFEVYLFSLNLRGLSPNAPFTLTEIFTAIKVVFLGQAIPLSISFLGILIIGSVITYFLTKRKTLSRAFLGLMTIWVITDIIPGFKVFFLSIISYISLVPIVGAWILTAFVGASEVRFSLYLWLLVIGSFPILFSQVTNPENLRGPYPNVFKKLTFGLVGLISVVIFALWYGLSSSSQASFLTKEARSRSAVIQELYEDPEFTIFVPAYLPEWANRMTEEKTAGNVWVFSFGPIVEARAYYRNYSNDDLTIAQYKPHITLTEGELYQKTLESFEVIKEPRFTEENIQKINLAGEQAIYYEIGGEKNMYLYRDGQIIQITISSLVSIKGYVYTFSSSEAKEELIKIAESIKPL